MGACTCRQEEGRGAADAASAEDAPPLPPLLAEATSADGALCLHRRSRMAERGEAFASAKVVGGGDALLSSGGPARLVA